MRKKKQKSSFFFFSLPTAKGFVSLLLPALTKESLVAWIVLPEVEISENEQSKGSRMKTSLQSSRNNFFLQEPFYSLREKKRSNHPETHGEMRGALALPWVTLAGPVWWKECENLRAGTFPFIFSSSPWWFPSLILLLLQFMASGLVLWLKQDPLTEPQRAAEFLCPSTEANLATRHFLKLLHAHH